MIDITERKRLTNELLRAQRMESVGRLASGIAHDMNNILAPIMMAAPLLRMALRPADVAKTLETIESSAQRGADLVRQLLLFARGAEGGRGPVDTVKLVRAIMHMAGETFPKNISVITDVPAGVWPMCGDVSQLHQVLLNLCVNARDAMPQGGTLKVSASNVEFAAGAALPHPDAKPGPYVALNVSDTGTGVPPAIVDRIFDPFFTTKEAGKGTGLGLSMVVGLVKSHGGFLNLRTAVDQGTTFEVFIPALPGAPESKTPRLRAPARGERELILVVDDEGSIRDVLRAALTRHNYRVLVATDGAEASAIFARHASEVKLVITDIDMPFMDGIKLIKVLRQLNPTTKVLVSSGIAMGKGAGDRSADLRALGLEKVLAKPYTVEEVLNAVQEAMTG
jgi:nitrogen-specific signal transduction histidine kinase/CheY-like chemotaxis protein